MPSDKSSQKEYFERDKDWAGSGANWLAMGGAAVHRMNIGIGLVAFAHWASGEHGSPTIRVDSSWF